MRTAQFCWGVAMRGPLTGEPASSMKTSLRLRVQGGQAAGAPETEAHSLPAAHGEAGQVLHQDVVLTRGRPGHSRATAQPNCL